MGTGEETIAAGTLLRRIGAPSDIAGAYTCYLVITPLGAARFDARRSSHVT